MVKPIMPQMREVRANLSPHRSPMKNETTLRPNLRGEAYLEILSHDYELSRNPAFVLQALVIAARRGNHVPDWVLDYFGHIAAPEIMDVFYEAQHTREGEVASGGTRTRNEAELIGKALGFSTTGRGSKSLLAEAANLDRAWEIHALVRAQLHKPTNESGAFEYLANETGLSAATIRRDYRRIESFLRQKKFEKRNIP
ncbi:MAG TPA: hypothetical protein VGT78_08980 [Rhizomicrobium sp.]|nr:hypothetical protein [Rhizomicrobium sp.]